MIHCGPCKTGGKEIPATKIYRMLTVPAPLGIVPVCESHARLMSKWGGTIEVSAQLLLAAMTDEEREAMAAASEKARDVE